MNAFYSWERLRDETGSRAIVVVGIGHMLRVELDLVVVEVEVRSVVEVTIAVIGKYVFIHPCHQTLRFTFATLQTISSQS